MGFQNPPIPWTELERRLAGRPPPANQPPGADGGDAPAWSPNRQPYQPPADPKLQPNKRDPGGRGRRGRTMVAYAELHCHSNASFLDGGSHPEELAEEAARLGLEALAITDHDGMYGIVRFAEAARTLALPTIFGAELTLTPAFGATRSTDGTTRATEENWPGQQPVGPQARRAQQPGGSQARRGQQPTRTGTPDPPGEHLVVLARDPEGYARLCRAISEAQMAGSKGAPRGDLTRLAALHGGHWLVLTGCRKGSVTRELVAGGPAAAAAELDRLIQAFGRDNLYVELWDHGDPLDSARNDALVRLADSARVEVVATNNVHYATPARRRLATALAAVRARSSLADLDGWLPAGAGAHLRSGLEQATRLARYPGAVELAAELGRALAFDLELVAPRLPDFPVPPGHTEMTWLRELASRGATRRYGPRGSERVPGAWRQIDHELATIEQLGFPGYFLIVWDIVQFCERADIYCQGRGSAANSAVCYAIGITKADAVSLGLLFERFLSPERDGPPDIDLDIEAGRREEVIQYVYERYGRDRAAQVANVITYRPRSAVRDMGRALGYAPGQLDAWSKQVDAWGPLEATVEHDIPEQVMELAREILHFPRHLGIHSGGMVICDRPVVEVCPVEWATMKDRSVLQWDKDDCAAVGLVKFDLLGLGMLSALHDTVDLVGTHHGAEVDLAELPQEAAVYDMLCQADSVGVFQVESRAQMATLPRLKPREFYDLVVEVALIRPGPIQGGSVHPYIRRRNGEEPVTYLHPLLERSLAKTLGVPLFQEQLMQMAVDVAGFSAAEADQLRQAMGAKRSSERMERLRGRLYQGMAERGIQGAVADRIYEKLAAFANFGFPESHSVSFAYLVYASAWLKLHYPAAFLAALLNAQPMGFWSPNTLVADARRHGVVVRGPDVNLSAAIAVLEGDGGVRLGLAYVRSLGEEVAERVAEGRPYASMADLVRRTGVTEGQVEALATAGAFGSLGLERRAALWAAGAVAQARADRLPGTAVGVQAPRLPGMSPVELGAADLWATGLSGDSHPVQFARERLDALGAVAADGLAVVPPGTRVLVGGVVTHRQRPATAGGTTFLNIEDETGLINVICSKGVWARHRRVGRTAAALLVRGRLERAEGVINVIADQLRPLPLAAATRSRDFR
ncbi:MAG TPA: error-prone DNA polymerase [Actinomycetes bacterium]|nr:error-prone DNA polymerase [Actinomycetes bacterium]